MHFSLVAYHCALGSLRALSRPLCHLPLAVLLASHLLLLLDANKILQNFNSSWFQKLFSLILFHPDPSCSKFPKLGFSDTWTENFQMFKLDLEKAEEPEITLMGYWKSGRVPEKHLFLLYWLCQSLWLCGSQKTVENSSRGGNTRPPDLPPEKSVCRSRSNS